MIKLSALLLTVVVAAWMFALRSAEPRISLRRSWLSCLLPKVAPVVLRPTHCSSNSIVRSRSTGAQLIVLSEHVDYWNHIGWTDPYSSRFFSDRQSALRQPFRLEQRLYAADGGRWRDRVCGQRFRLASRAVEKALALPKVAVRISGISLDAAKTLQAHIDTDALPESLKVRKADVYLVVALNHAESQVLRGENSGRRLTHVGVVQSLTKIGSIESGKTFSQDVHMKLDSQDRSGQSAGHCFHPAARPEAGPGRGAAATPQVNSVFFANFAVSWRPLRLRGLTFPRRSAKSLNRKGRKVVRKGRKDKYLVLPRLP